MTVLNDFQFELLPAVDATDGEVFGIGADVSIDEEGFHPGSTDWANQNTQSSATGNTLFGRDKLLGPVWAWDAFVDRDDCENAVDSLAKFTTAWRSLAIRDTPGLILPLRYALAGRTRRIYGRPGKLEASPTNLILSGYTPVTCDFTCFDAFTYADDATGVTLVLGGNEEGNSGGGLTLPAVLPINSSIGTEEIGHLTVGGDAPAYAVYRLNGPWTSPSVYTDDWLLSLPDYEIPVGSYVEIDTRPWANTVLLNGETSIAGVLGRRQTFQRAKLYPGDFEVRIGGFSSTGAATCQITWRDTFNSI